jgi:hypothetical protein
MLLERFKMFKIMPRALCQRFRGKAKILNIASGSKLSLILSDFNNNFKAASQNG